MVEKAKNAQKPIIVVASCNPYDLLGEEQLATDIPVVYTFEFTAPALDTAAELIFDKLVPKGSLPVKI